MSGPRRAVLSDQYRQAQSYSLVETSLCSTDLDLSASRESGDGGGGDDGENDGCKPSEKSQRPESETLSGYIH